MPRRYAAADAKFSIKEVDIGLAADLGTLQRLPKIVGNDSVVRELAYTARVFGADEALSFGMYARFPPFPLFGGVFGGRISLVILINALVGVDSEFGGLR